VKSNQTTAVLAPFSTAIDTQAGWRSLWHAEKEWKCRACGGWYQTEKA